MNLLRPIDRHVSVGGLVFHVLDWGGEGPPPPLGWRASQGELGAA